MTDFFSSPDQGAPALDEPPEYMGPAGYMNDPEFEVVGICHRCKHLSKKDPMKCDAFPDGIPATIRAGEFIHTKPYPGDHGIQFSPLGGVK